MGLRPPAWLRNRKVSHKTFLVPPTPLPPTSISFGLFLSRKKRKRRDHLKKLNCSSWLHGLIRVAEDVSQHLNPAVVQEKKWGRNEMKIKKRTKRIEDEERKGQEIGFFSGCQWMDSIVELKGYWRWQSAKSFDSLSDWNEGRDSSLSAMALYTTLVNYSRSIQSLE